MTLAAVRFFPRVKTPSLTDVRGRVPRPEQVQPVSGPPPIALNDPRRADDAVPFGLRVAAGVSWRVLLVAAALYLLGQIIGRTSTVVIPVAVALLLTSLLMPAAVFLNHKLRFPRALAAITTLLGALAILIGLLYFAGNQVVVGVSQLSGQVEQGVNQIQNWLRDGPLAGPQISQAIDQGRNWVQSNAGPLTSGAVSGAVTAGNLVVATIMALFAIFFFLSDGDRMWAWFVRLAPKEIRSPIHEAGRRGWVTLSSYVKTQVIVAAVDAVLIGLGAFLLGLPLVVPLALIVFFSAAIPVVGAVVSGALAVILALVVQGPLIALAMMGVVLAVQQIEGNLLQPILMSKAVSLHPLATILGVAVGSYLFGIVGALFAVPVLAVTNTVVLYLNGHDKFPMLDQNASVLTNSAKELTGDKHAPKDEESPPAPGGDSPASGR
ncbi:AI-2E family transporter [Mobilicoccus caccae]|uniref:AI-2E family transporter n=1 Tax=Mobilicoccus caccae TaxID=1859295 RepID=A0ABQ6IXS6_9MICO|nr:AI-2E family transporter [Mobilicoccus caccae]